jgi:hypothetical protein
VTFRNSLILIGLALVISTALYASRLATSSSDYGMVKPSACTSSSGDNTCVLNGLGDVTLTAQDFLDTSNNPNFLVFDFLVSGAISDFDLTVDLGSAQLATDGFPPTYGAFAGSTCSTSTTPATFTDNPGVYCGPDPTGPDPSNPLVTFPTVTDHKVVFQVNESNNSFVFFVVVAEDASLIATISQNTSSVPEPSSLPFLAAAGVAVTVLGRRRLAKLLK